MIKLIAFDLGDVLAKDTFKALIKKFGVRRLSAFQERRYQRALQKVGTGQTTEHEFIDELHATIVPGLSSTQIHRLLMQTKLLPPWNLAHRLKRNYQIAIWTNNHKTGPAAFSRILHTPFAEFPIVNSAYVGIMKPQPAFFKKAMQKFDVKPSEVLFIDDSRENPQAARKLGIASFRYVGKMQPLRSFLEKHGVISL